MQIDKDTILKLMKQQGRQSDASAAANELPDKVDTKADAGLLAKYGIDAQDLLDKLPAGVKDKIDGLPGGLGKKLNDLL